MARAAGTQAVVAGEGGLKLLVQQREAVCSGGSWSLHSMRPPWHVAGGL